MGKKYAIMFADVARGTAMYDKLGNNEAEKQIAWCIQTMTDITNSHGDHVIKTIDDEIMASFGSTTEAAIDMQTNISGNIANRLSIRISLHYGAASQHLSKARIAATGYDFDTANKHISTVIKMSPSHSKLADTQDKVFEYKNQQLVKKAEAARKSELEKQASTQPAPTSEPENKPRRSFGGF